MKKVRKLPTYLVPASYGKRAGAFALDAFFAFVVGFAINNTLGAMVIAPAAGYNEAQAEYFDLAVASGLYQRNESGNVEAFVFTDDKGEMLKDEALYNNWETLHDKIWNYYFVEAGQANGETNFTLPDFSSEEKLGSKAYQEELGKYLYQNIYLIQVEGEEEIEHPNAYFVAPLSDGIKDYTKIPVLNEETKNKFSSDNIDTRLATKKSVWQYFNGDSQTTYGLYYTARASFMSQEKAMALNAIGNKAAFYANIPGVVFAPFLFFFFFPVVLKRGKTLGKLITKISVVSQEGYKAKKPNILLHALVLMLPMELLILPVNQLLMMGLLGFVYIGDYLVAMFSKNHQSVHEMLSATIVIDDRQTEAIFDTPEEEAEYGRNNDDTLARMIRGYGENDLPTATIKSAPVVLDSRTIGSARKEAASIVSFDEYEAKKDAEEKEEAIDPSSLSDEELLEDPEMKAMMEMDGLSKEEILAMQEDEEGEKEDEDPNDDDFVDSPETK